MNERVKETAVSAEDEPLKVFVRSRIDELTMDDLEVVAGGRKAMWVPWG